MEIQKRIIELYKSDKEKEINKLISKRREQITDNVEEFVKRARTIIFRL